MLPGVEVLYGKELTVFIALIELPKMVYQYLQSQFKGSIHSVLLWTDRGSDW